MKQINHMQKMDSLQPKTVSGATVFPGTGGGAMTTNLGAQPGPRVDYTWFLQDIDLDALDPMQRRELVATAKKYADESNSKMLASDANAAANHAALDADYASKASSKKAREFMSKNPFADLPDTFFSGDPDETLRSFDAQAAKMFNGVLPSNVDPDNIAASMGLSKDSEDYKKIVATVKHIQGLYKSQRSQLEAEIKRRGGKKFDIKDLHAAAREHAERLATVPNPYSAGDTMIDPALYRQEYQKFLDQYGGAGRKPEESGADFDFVGGKVTQTGVSGMPNQMMAAHSPFSPSRMPNQMKSAHGQQPAAKVPVSGQPSGAMTTTGVGDIDFAKINQPDLPDNWLGGAVSEYAWKPLKGSVESASRYVYKSAKESAKIIGDEVGKAYKGILAQGSRSGKEAPKDVGEMLVGLYQSFGEFEKWATSNTKLKNAYNSARVKAISKGEEFPEFSDWLKASIVELRNKGLVQAPNANVPRDVPPAPHEGMVATLMGMGRNRNKNRGR